MINETISRRIFLGGFFAYAMRHESTSLFAAPPAGKAKRILVLWMQGGPSQIDTFDPKPGTETGGEFQAISTAARGVKISETLPRIARRMKKLSIIRSINSREGDHLRGQYLLHTGYPLVEGFARPAAGSVVSKHAPAAKFPKYVSIGSAGFGPAYMGVQHAPFSIENAEQALQTLRALESRRPRIQLMQSLNKGFDEKHMSGLLERRREVVRQIEELVDTPFVRALDLKKVSASDRARYGDENFGRQCLLARRLLEVGVNFVEVQQGGWDTHVDNFANVRRACATIDRPWAALMDDLEAKGLLDETVVIWMGEFGRTPTINARNGRDHYPRVTCAVVGGGGIEGGRVVGETNRLGTSIVKDRVTVADLFATVFSRMGIDPKKRFRTDFGGTATTTDKGTPIKGLL